MLSIWVHETFLDEVRLVPKEGQALTNCDEVGSTTDTAEVIVVGIRTRLGSKTAGLDEGHFSAELRITLCTSHVAGQVGDWMKEEVSSTSSSDGNRSG